MTSADRKGARPAGEGNQGPTMEHYHPKVFFTTSELAANFENALAAWRLGQARLRQAKGKLKQGKEPPDPAPTRP